MINLDHIGYFLLAIVLSFLVLRMFDARMKKTDLLWLPLLTFGFYWFLLNYCAPQESANLWTNLFSELPYQMRENFELELQVNNQQNQNQVDSKKKDDAKDEFLKAIDEEELQPIEKSTVPPPKDLPNPPEKTTFATVSEPKNQEFKPRDPLPTEPPLQRKEAGVTPELPLLGQPILQEEPKCKPEDRPQKIPAYEFNKGIEREPPIENKELHIDERTQAMHGLYPFIPGMNENHAGVDTLIQHSIMNQLARETENQMVPPMPPYSTSFIAAPAMPNNSIHLFVHGTNNQQQQMFPEPADSNKFEQNFYFLQQPQSEVEEKQKIKGPVSAEFAWSMDSSRLTNRKDDPKEIKKEEIAREDALASKGKIEVIPPKKETIHIKIGKSREDEVPIRSQPKPTCINKVRAPNQVPSDIYADKSGGERILKTNEWDYSFDGLLPKELVAKLEESPDLKKQPACFPSGVILNSAWSEWKPLQ